MSTVVTVGSLPRCALRPSRTAPPPPHPTAPCRPRPPSAVRRAANPRRPRRPPLRPCSVPGAADPRHPAAVMPPPPPHRTRPRSTTALARSAVEEEEEPSCPVCRPLRSLLLRRRRHRRASRAHRSGLNSFSQGCRPRPESPSPKAAAAAPEVRSPPVPARRPARRRLPSTIAHARVQSVPSSNKGIHSVDAAAAPRKGGEYRPSFADGLLLTFFRSKMVELQKVGWDSQKNLVCRTDGGCESSYGQGEECFID
ncbi:serine/arginine repetitive matrix protein 1-like isoform X2 [Panicum virgatum]|uniref:serine/arginine repetitive matrix protein 1-like isoform X2 n=1 Tax=Panicum virgatum TaxID=38727 RepID=UPI0019D553C2|nr:serine/arginine repetitive matrix protein 1-like isoform X2 [Panicum virgatum]